MSSSKKRQLAAILFADIVGYTALMQRDEQQALASLQKFKSELEKQVPENQGRIIQFYGDGCLAIFTSSVDAMTCAKGLQEAFQSEPKVPVRIGLHAGDVIFKENNVFGDAVNIASRVESMGIPGAVLLSSSLRNQIKNQPEFELAPLGRFEFKNVAEAMTIYALANEGFPIPKMEEMKGKLKIFQKKTDFQKLWLLFVALAAITGFTYWTVKNKKATVSKYILNKKIAVLIFDNNTGDERLDIIGKIASDWITNQFQQTGIKEIVTSNNVQQNIQYAGILPNTPGQKSSFYRQTGARYWIEGDYFQKAEELLIQSKLVDAISGKIIVNFPTISSPVKEPLEGVQQLTDYILGYWQMEEDNFQASTFKEIPSVQAYEAFFQAWENFYIDHKKTVKLFHKAIELDSNFHSAKLMLIQSHFNFGEYAKVDSLIKDLESKKGISDFHKKYLQYFRYDLQGKRKESAKTYLELFNMDKKDIITNYLASYAPLNKLNMPELAVQNFTETPDSLIPYDKLYVYSWRLRYLADAYWRSGEIEKALAVFDNNSSKFPSARADQVKAFILASLPDRQEELVEFLKATEQKEYVDRHFATVLKEAIQSWRLKTNEEELDKGKFLKKFLNSVETKENELEVALSYYYLGEYQKAARALEQVVTEDSQSPSQLSLMVRIQLQLKNKANAEKWFDRLAALNRPYDRGATEYAMAQAMAVEGNWEIALDLLEKAVDKGVLFMFYRFDGDPDLKGLFNHPKYQKIIAKRRIPLLN